MVKKNTVKKSTPNPRPPKKRVSVQIVDPEMQVWVSNAARNLDISESQFLETVMYQAFESYYGRTFTWKGWKLVWCGDNVNGK
jgi:hypothetical protein